MPTYQYACLDCREQHEAVQTFTDAALTTCPSCQGQLRKVFSAVGVVFKGSGFYRTDSRTSATTGRKAASKAAPERTSPDSTPAASSSTKTPAAAGAAAS
jgi:putative FmdB family regulatory protein